MEAPDMGQNLQESLLCHLSSTMQILTHSSKAEAWTGTSSNSLLPHYLPWCCALCRYLSVIPLQARHSFPCFLMELQGSLSCSWKKR